MPTPPTSDCIAHATRVHLTQRQGIFLWWLLKGLEGTAEPDTARMCRQIRLRLEQADDRARP